MDRRSVIQAVLDYCLAHWLELTGAVLGLIQIWLLVRRSIWNFPLAMASVSLIAVTLFKDKLYSEAGLQVFFFVVNAAGWFQWLRIKEAGHTIPVSWMTGSQRMVWLAITVLLSLSLGWLMHTFTDAALPFADSAIAGASIAAQLLLNWRRIENWVLWVVIDVASVALYINRELYFLAGLYLAFLVISVIGLKQWMAAEKGEAAA